MNPDQQVYIDTVRDQIKAGTYKHLMEDIPYGDGVMVDIGANTGEVSKYFAPLCKFVLAVEPCVETFLMLQKNTAEYPQIHCDRHALAPTEGNVGFYINDLNFTASSTVNTYGKFEPNYVMGARLSKLLEVWNLKHVDVCKIDAEGAEGASLTYDEIQRCKDIVKTFFVEVHNCPSSTWEHKLGTLVGNLARCGYHKMQINGMAITATK